MIRSLQATIYGITRVRTLVDVLRIVGHVRILTQGNRDCKVDLCRLVLGTPDNRSYARSGYGRAIVETLAARSRIAPFAFVPLIAGPVARTVFSTRAAVETEFCQLFFVGFLAARTMRTLAETPGASTVNRAFVFLAPLF